MPAAVLLERLQAGEIMDDQGRPQCAGSPYRGGRWLWYYREVPDEIPVPFELDILHRDARLVVVDKPHFMATTPGGRYLRHTALVRLRNELDLPHLSPIHRLDRETAGVLVFCADPAYRGRYQTLFQAREVGKEYEAVAAPPDFSVFPLVYRSRLEEMSGRFLMHEVPGEANSETRLELLSELGDGLAHLRLQPLTGRKHQLRAHLCALGMPILNDSFYPVTPYDDKATARSDDDFGHPLQLLARAIEFRDPVDGRLHRYESRRTLQCAALAGITVS